MNTHKFDTTGEAYDACQCDESIKTGDLLIIESEAVVGIADTWPVAVTVEHGKLHFPAGEFTLFRALKDRESVESINWAKAAAQERGWPVRP